MQMKSRELRRQGARKAGDREGRRRKQSNAHDAEKNKETKAKERTMEGERGSPIGKYGNNVFDIHAGKRYCANCCRGHYICSLMWLRVSMRFQMTLLACKYLWEGGNPQQPDLKSTHEHKHAFTGLGKINLEAGKGMRM